MTSPEQPAAPQRLSAEHDLDAFDSGVSSLDHWLRSRALRNDRDGASRTFVACVGIRVVGFYSLAATSVSHEMAAGKARRNMPDPVPAVLIGRLAVDRGWRGRRLGIGLLLDAVTQVVRISDTIGVRVILVHAISNEAKLFYERLGFRESPLAPMTLMMTIEEITGILARMTNS